MTKKLYASKTFLKMAGGQGVTTVRYGIIFRTIFL